MVVGSIFWRRYCVVGIQVSLTGLDMTIKKRPGKVLRGSTDH